MTPPTDERQSRRTFLRAGGAALATVVAASNSGCSGLPPLGTRVRYGTVDEPTSREPRYRNWLPEPAAFPAESDHDSGSDVHIYEPPTGETPGWTRDSVSRTLLLSRIDYVGVHVDDASVAVATDGAAALLGEVDRQTVRTTLGETPYEPDGTHAGYEMYTRTDIDRSVGVGPDAVVFGNGETARQNVIVTIDAGRGEVPRYHERNEAFATLTDSVGTRRWVWLWPTGVGRVDGDDIREETTGWATGFDYDGDAAYFVRTWQFPAEYDLTQRAVKRSLKRDGRTLDASAVDVDIDRQVATIAMQLPIEEVAQESPEYVAPHVTWRATYDADTAQLTFHHDAGEPVPTANLTVSPEMATATFDVGTTLDPGEAIPVPTAGLESGTTVSLVYQATDGYASTTLTHYEIP